MTRVAAGCSGAPEPVRFRRLLATYYLLTTCQKNFFAYWYSMVNCTLVDTVPAPAAAVAKYCA